jgi:hypothetical protein
VFKARSAFVAVLVFSVFAVFALPAFAQAASITVDQTCIDPGSVETGGGLVSGTFTGAPTGSPYTSEGNVSVDQFSGDNDANFGSQRVTVDPLGGGSFSFHLAQYYGSQLPDTLWVKLRVVDSSAGMFVPVGVEVEVPVCGREPDPGPTTIYNFDGFFAPVENRDAANHLVLNRVQAGLAVPLKFKLGGDYGLDVFDTGYPKSETIACNSDTEVNGVDQTVNAGASSLTYNAATGTYTYVWKTAKAWLDTCRQLVLKFDDGTTARANFTFVK